MKAGGRSASSWVDFVPGGQEGRLECGAEVSAAQLDDSVKLNQALSRVAFDLLVYVYARAVELRPDEGAAVLEMHSSDQTLIGRDTRGCGVVFCEAGRKVFASAVALVRGSLSSPPA